MKIKNTMLYQVKKLIQDTGLSRFDFQLFIGVY